MRAPAIGRIVVSYNSGELLYRAVEAADHALMDTVVVDNASHLRPSRARLATHQAELVTLDENIGFGRACNIGAARTTADWLAFVNPDTEIDWSSLLLATKAAEANGWAFVGIPLADSEGRPELVIGPWLAPWVLFGVSVRVVLGDAAVTRLRSRLHRRQQGSKPPIDLPAGRYISGACLLVDRKSFFQVGGFDERIFLYGEDAKLCRDLFLIGCRGGLAPCGPGLHHRGASGGREIYRSERVLPLLAHAARLDRRIPWRLGLAAALLPGLVMSALVGLWPGRIGRSWRLVTSHLRAIGRCLGRAESR